VLVTETAKTWVSIFDDLRFLSDNKGFIWSSERSGRKHLYLYDMNGKLLHPISKGDWGIEQLLAVDEKTGRVFVESNRDAVIDNQTYALKLDGSSAENRAPDPGRRLAQHRLCPQRRSVCRHLLQPGHAAASQHPPS
jgi:dipeptidyl-peptidase-4